MSTDLRESQNGIIPTPAQQAITLYQASLLARDLEPFCSRISGLAWQLYLGTADRLLSTAYVAREFIYECARLRLSYAQAADCLIDNLDQFQDQDVEQHHAAIGGRIVFSSHGVAVYVAGQFLRILDDPEVAKYFGKGVNEEVLHRILEASDNPHMARPCSEMDRLIREARGDSGLPLGMLLDNEWRQLHAKLRREQATSEPKLSAQTTDPVSRCAPEFVLNVFDNAGNVAAPKNDFEKFSDAMESLFSFLGLGLPLLDPAESLPKSKICIDCLQVCLSRMRAALFRLMQGHANCIARRERSKIAELVAWAYRLVMYCKSLEPIEVISGWPQIRPFEVTLTAAGVRELWPRFQQRTYWAIELMNHLRTSEPTGRTGIELSDDSNATANGQADKKGDTKKKALEIRIPSTPGFPELWKRYLTTKENGEHFSVNETAKEVAEKFESNPHSLTRAFRRYRRLVEGADK